MLHNIDEIKCLLRNKINKTISHNLRGWFAFDTKSQIWGILTDFP